MTQLPYTLISVFTNSEKQHKGNITAIVHLKEEKLTQEQMQNIALDLNQPATTFMWEENNQYHLRWFAPDSEIQLCGHGTMGIAAFMKNKGIHQIQKLLYSQGEVNILTESDLPGIELDKGTYHSDAPPVNLSEALGIPIKEYYTTSDKDIVVTSDQKTLQLMQPNFDALKKMKPFGYAVTASGDEVDFVSRTLVPKVQQLEDHATGSSHTVLVPFWSQVLQKNEMTAHQLSPRGGTLYCKALQNKIQLNGDFDLIGDGVIYQK